MLRSFIVNLLVLFTSVATELRMNYNARANSSGLSPTPDSSKQKQDYLISLTNTVSKKELICVALIQEIPESCIYNSLKCVEARHKGNYLLFRFSFHCK